MRSYRLFSGSANRPLAEAVARELGTSLSPCTTERFPDGELTVRLEESVRGCEVFVLQPTSPPVNDHLIELLAFADACRHAAAERVVALVPYFGYARSDRRAGRREPIMASLVADLLQSAGIRHLVTVDAHTAQLEAFFRVPVDNLTAIATLCDVLRDRLPEDVVVVAPDLGAVQRATAVAARLGRPMALLHKQRLSGSEVEIRRIVGEVRDRSCLIVDDMISTGSTVVKSVEALRSAGARPEVRVAATHGVFSADALARLRSSGVAELWVTDTIQMVPQPGIRVVSIAPLLAETMRRLTGVSGVAPHPSGP
jgi:ribose-phosphate pyrophosphokinase